jgi:acyl-CoA synthetase (AMP-forming)/AMP-acid ligase II
VAVPGGLIYLSPAPLYHSAPQAAVNLAIRHGGTVIIMEKFDPEQYLRLVERYRVTHSQLEPGSPFRYYDDTEKTAESTSPDGSMVTVGDVGYLDDDGYLYLTDRATFMIISGGVNIYPRSARTSSSPTPRSPTPPSSASPTKTSARKSRPSSSSCPAPAPGRRSPPS